MASKVNRKWWKEAVVYQIYPRSFKDSNDDGVGDLKGITQKLNYLKELGVDVIWLSPCYKSPNDDNGYDISDYYSIMDEFGTLEDWEEMIEGMHSRGIKLLMDLVVNHTSDEHRWFKESRKSPDNKYRDYYYWRDSEKGREPNDWLSYFGGSVWEYDKVTEQYYLHLFSKKQPDLNWENPLVRDEIYSMMKWWLDKGVDGFRMDIINAISKTPSLPFVGDGTGYNWGGEHFTNGPRVHEFLKEMNDEVLSKYDIMTVGETAGVNVDDAKKYSSQSRHELNMVFQFELMDVDNGNEGKWTKAPWDLVEVKKINSHWQIGLEDKGWNSLYLNNHDQPRMVSRFGNDKKYWSESAKLLATLLHTLKGTPYIYQGEEIGMTNIKLDNIEDFKDVESINKYHVFKEQGYQEEEIIKMINQGSRDNARTPMQWSDDKYAGFSLAKPWIKVNPNYKKINVSQSVKDELSIFNYYKKLIQLRKENPIIVYGKYADVDMENKDVYAYARTYDDEKLFVTLNFSKKEKLFNVPDEFNLSDSKILISNYTNNDYKNNIIKLKPYEAIVFKNK